MEGVLKMKRRIILVVVVALAVTITGCGTENQEAVKSQKKVTVTENKKSENQKKDSEKKETIICASEMGSIEVAVAGNQISGEESVENTVTDTVVENTAGENHTNSNSSTPSGNHTNSNNSSSGNTSSGGSASGNTSTGNTSGNSSNGNSSNNTPTQTEQPTQSVHTHTWVHVDATGHYETVTIQAAYDEQIPVYEEKARSICNQCGADITGNIDAHFKDSGYVCGGYHVEYIQIQTGTQTIHHDAVTEQRWIEDTPAHEQCSGCGATR